jgi:hypothetical protein
MEDDPSAGADERREGAGHLVPFTRADSVNSVLVDFLERSAPG